MNWAQSVKQEQKRIEFEQTRALASEGMAVREISEEQYYDGVGITIGLNVWNTDGKCLTFADALAEIGDTRNALGEALRKFRSHPPNKTAKPAPSESRRKGKGVERMEGCYTMDRATEQYCNHENYNDDHSGQRDEVRVWCDCGEEIGTMTEAEFAEWELDQMRDAMFDAGVGYGN